MLNPWISQQDVTNGCAAVHYNTNIKGIQSNTDNLARITQMEKEKAMLIKNCDHFKAAMVKAQQAERAWNN
eukprot:5949984-Amphidinium_carterae.1